MVTTDGSGTYTGSVDTSVNLPWLNMMTIGKDSYYGIWNNNPIKRLAFMEILSPKHNFKIS